VLRGELHDACADPFSLVGATHLRVDRERVLASVGDDVDEADYSGAG